MTFWFQTDSWRSSRSHQQEDTKQHEQQYMYWLQHVCFVLRTETSHLENMVLLTGKASSSSGLTVALVARIYPPFQSFSFCELGQHFRQHALCLVNRDNPLLNRVIALRKLQGKIPKGLNGVGFVVACYTGDLGIKTFTHRWSYAKDTCRQAFTLTPQQHHHAQKAVCFHRHRNTQSVKRNAACFQFES